MFHHVTESRVFLPDRPDMDDMGCFQISRGHLSRREANWERRESSVSDSVALDTVSRPVPQSERGRRAVLARQDALSSGSSNTDSNPRLQSPADSCGSLPWLLSPGVAISPAVSPLWTGSGLPPPPSWTLRSPGLRPSSTVQRSVSSASSRTKPDYAGWTDDTLPAGTRHTANSQPTVSTQRQGFLRPRAQRPTDWIIQHTRKKPRVRPQQLPGLSNHQVDTVVRRAATNSDNSLSSSDSGGRCRAKSRDLPVPAVTMVTVECKQPFLSVDTAEETRNTEGYPHPRPPAAAFVSPAAQGGNATVQSLSVPSSSVRRRSISLGRTSSAFSRAFDDDDAQ